jgi:hypothetical protein
LFYFPDQFIILIDFKFKIVQWLKYSNFLKFTICENVHVHSLEHCPVACFSLTSEEEIVKILLALAFLFELIHDRQQ